jgi:hypothetical protein
MSGARQCSIDGCENRSLARDWCAKHYQRWQHNGSPTITKNKYPQRGSLIAFIEKSLLSDTDECIEWPFGRARNYGYFNGTSASHTICERAHGPRPSAAHEVAHSCRNPPCINKRHLRWATHAENEKDKIGHGTIPCGERNPVAKLNENAVRNIRSVLATGGGNIQTLADQFGVSRALISKIMRRKLWAHVA